MSFSSRISRRQREDGGATSLICSTQVSSSQQDARQPSGDPGAIPVNLLHLLRYPNLVEEHGSEPCQCRFKSDSEYQPLCGQTHGGVTLRTTRPNRADAQGLLVITQFDSDPRPNTVKIHSQRYTYERQATSGHRPKHRSDQTTEYRPASQPCLFARSLAISAPHPAPTRTDGRRRWSVADDCKSFACGLSGFDSHSIHQINVPVARIND